MQRATACSNKKYNNRREQYLAVLWAILDGIQLLCLVMGRTSGFAAGVTRPFLRWIDLYALFTQHEIVAFSARPYRPPFLSGGAGASGADGAQRTFWALFGITLFVLVSFLYYVLRLQKNKGREVQIWMSIAARGCLYGIYIPYLKVFGSTVHAAVAAGTLALFVLASLFFFLLFRHNHIHCPDWESRPHGRFHAAYALGRLLMVAASVVVAEESTIRGGFLGAGTYLALASCVLTSVGKRDDALRVLASSVAAALAGFAFAAAAAAVKFRYWQIGKLAAAQEVESLDPTEAELAVRVLLTEDDSPAAVQKAELMLRNALLQFPASAYVHIILAHVLKSFANNPNAASAEIRNGWRKEPAIDYRYELHSTKLFWERQAQVHAASGAGGAAADLFSSADAKRQPAHTCGPPQARTGHTRTIKLIRAFWLADIAQTAKEADQVYALLIKRPPPSARGASSAGAASRGRVRRNDKARAQLYFMKADEVEESESKTASLSASQSQSQSQSAGGGPSAKESASVSESASSGASSSALARKRAGNKELKMRANETRAVRRLFWGVVVGLLFLAALATAMFIAVKLLFVEYTQASQRLRFLSFQRRRVVAVNNMIRWMHLSALGNGAPLARAPCTPPPHGGFGYEDTGMPPSTTPALVEYWRQPDADIIKFFPGPPIYEIHERQSMWDAGNAIMIACRRISLMHPDNFRDLQKIKEVKFVFQNALFGILEELNVGAGLYEDEVMGVIEKAKWVLLAICCVSICTLISEALFVFRPSFKNVRITMRGVSDILSGIPRPLLKQVAKHYSKAHKRAQDEDGSDASASDGEEGGKSRRGSASSSSEAASGDEDSDGGRARSRSTRRLRLQRKKPAEEEAAGSDEEGGPDPKSDGDREGGAGEKKARKKHGGRKEKKRGASRRKQKKGKAAESDTGATSVTESEAEVKAAAAAAAVPVPPLPALKAGRRSRGGRRGAWRRPDAGADAGPLGSFTGSTGSRTGGSGAKAAHPKTPVSSVCPRRPGPPPPPRGPSGARRRQEELLALPDLMDAPYPEAGKGGKNGKAGGEERRAIVADLFPELRRPSAALERRPSVASGGMLRGGRPREPGRHDAGAGGGAGGEGLPAALRLAIGEEEDPKAALQLPPKAAPPAEEGAGKGKGRKKRGEGEDPEAEAAKSGKSEKKEKSSGSGSSSGDEAAKKKKKEREKKKGEEGESRGPDILDMLTRKYTIAFVSMRRFCRTGARQRASSQVIIGGIFIVNFIVCFVILDAGKGFAYEINLGGRRRSIAREVAFYARELYINDGIFLERQDIFERLQQKTELFKSIHQGLKFGDKEFQVTGANGRNKALDTIMYDSECLRLQQSKCTPDRVEDMQLVVNGLDALVMGVVDIVTMIMQETAPDLLLTGKEDPSIVRKNNYNNLNSKQLNLMMEIDEGDLDDGLNQAVGAIVTEAVASMAALILSFVVIFLMVLYVYLFAPMLARLGEETGRAGQILKMCVHLHSYFVGINGDNEDD
eukprot:tig00001284_g8016.t1